MSWRPWGLVAWWVGLIVVVIAAGCGGASVASAAKVESAVATVSRAQDVHCWKDGWLVFRSGGPDFVGARKMVYDCNGRYASGQHPHCYVLVNSKAEEATEDVWASGQAGKAGTAKTAQRFPCTRRLIMAASLAKFAQHEMHIGEVGLALWASDRHSPEYLQAKPGSFERHNVANELWSARQSKRIGRIDLKRAQSIAAEYQR